jgi:hypothetical protein
VCVCVCVCVDVCVCGKFKNGSEFFGIAEVCVGSKGG